MTRATFITCAVTCVSGCVVVVAGCGVLDGTGVVNHPLRADVVTCVTDLGFINESCTCTTTPASDFDAPVDVCGGVEGHCCLALRTSTAAASCTCVSDGDNAPARECADTDEEVERCDTLEPSRFFEGAR